MKLKHIPYKTAAFLILLGLILPLLFLPQIQALDPTKQNIQDKANFLISTIQNANQSITQTITQLKGKDVLIPQSCLDTFREAQVLVDQATEVNQEKDYSQAIDLALQATQKIKATLTLLDGLVDQATTGSEDSYKQTLQNTIDRCSSLLERYEDITTSAQNRGTDVTAISTKLSAIRTTLDSAKSNFNQEKFEVTKDEITRTTELLSELTIYFNNLATRVNSEKISTYIVNAQQNLTDLTEQVNSPSSALTSDTRAAATATITQAQTSLDKAMQYFENQQISQTISELANVQASQVIVHRILNPVSPTTIGTSPTPLPNVSITDSTNAAIPVK